MHMIETEHKRTPIPKEDYRPTKRQIVSQYDAPKLCQMVGVAR